MDTTEVLGFLIERAPGSMRDVSRSLGKYPTWARNVLTNTSDPRLSTVAGLASLSGLRLSLTDESGAVVATVTPADTSPAERTPGTDAEG